MSASTWFRLLRGGSVSSSSLSNRMAPTRLPPLVRSRAKVVASSHRTSSFGRSIGPKPIERDRSSSSHAVSSRSSAYWRTNGCPSAPSRSSRCAGRRPPARTREGRGSPFPPRETPSGSSPAGCRRDDARPLPLEPVGAARASAPRGRGVRGAHVSGASGGHALAERELWNRDRREDAVDYRVGSDSVSERLVRQHEAVTEHVVCDLPGGPARARTRVPGRAPRRGRRGSC